MRIVRTQALTPRGALSAALAALFVAASTGGLVHEESVSHVRCPEHGELIHVELSEAPGVFQAPSAASTVRGGPESSEQHGHEHCTLGLHSRDPSLSSPQRALEARPSPALSAPPERAELAAQPARHRLAPKQSPPA